MRWHPDRNSAAGAEKKFQEIQNAYRTLLPRHKPRTLRDMWEETAGDGLEEEPEESSPFWGNFPFLAAGCLVFGAVFLVAAEYPGNWIVFSLALAAAGRLYKTGDNRLAFRIESAFRLSLHAYFTGLLAWGVWALFLRVVGK